jgi:hypothetical protein
MARFIVTSLLVVVAVTFAAAVEARDVAIIDASSYKLSSINRRLLGVCDAHPVDDGTDQICDKVGVARFSLSKIVVPCNAIRQ